MSLRDTILEADDLQREEVDVPEWGCTVYVRTLPARDLDRWESEWNHYRRRNGMDEQDTTNFRAFLAVYVLTDADGNLIFGDRLGRPDHEAVEALGAKSGAALNRIADAALRVNGISARDQEELVKNSAGSPSADSPSD